MRSEKTNPFGEVRAKRWMRNFLAHFGYRLTRITPDIYADEFVREMICRARPYTITSPERMVAMWDATRYLSRYQIPGAIVECGVWRGGSMMIAAMALLRDHEERDLFLFDTYEGMPEASAIDRDIYGWSGDARIRTNARADGSWLSVSVEEVQQNMESTGYSPRLIHYVRGLVEDTVPSSAPERIALLRLDTDWYQSTKHELEHLVPRMTSNGVLIIDDYGHWEGARNAVDEYFNKSDRPTLLCPIDYTGRLAVIG